MLQVTDPSLLRFLVDMRGADPSDKQLRDDLMTMLIAGHETTAAVLTWTLFLLMQHPEIAARVVAEVDSVLTDKLPSATHPSTICAAGVDQAPSLDVQFALSVFVLESVRHVL